MARKVKFDFKPFQGLRVTTAAKNQAMKQISDFVVESVLSDVGSQKSPVSGRSFKKLSPDYKAFKRASGRRGVPNLEFDGDMLDAVRVKRVDENTLRLTVLESQQPKADGHNNFSGRSQIPRRAFVPDEKRKENFTRQIQKGIDAIVRRTVGTDKSES